MAETPSTEDILGILMSQADWLKNTELCPRCRTPHLHRYDVNDDGVSLDCPDCDITTRFTAYPERYELL